MRCQSEFVTRLRMNDKNLEQVKELKMLGVWLSDTFSWQKNCEEICKKAYKRIPLITKLKYIGVQRQDLLDIYKLFIRSVLEYASVVYHSKLTQKQESMLDSVEKLCLKIILSSDYQDYERALVDLSLSILRERRQARVDRFIVKALKHDKHKHMFPISNKYSNDIYSLRKHEKYQVNRAKTKSYQTSFIPYAQRRLNKMHYDGLI